MSIILTLMLLMSGVTLDMYTENFEDSSGMSTDEKHFYATVIQDDKGVLLTIDYDLSSDDISVLY